MNFGERLKELREKNNLTQTQLGKIFNICHSNISKYESGQLEVDTKFIKILAEYFDVTTDYLLGRTDDKNIALIQGDALPKELREAGVEYVEVLREMVAEGLSAQDIREILQFAKKMKK